MNNFGIVRTGYYQRKVAYKNRFFVINRHAPLKRGDLKANFVYYPFIMNTGQINISASKN